MDYRKLSKEELVELLELRDRPVRAKDPEEVYGALSEYANAKQERFIVVMLDNAMHIIKREVVSLGTVNHALVHPREVFAPCIENRATACVLAHNHPSGVLTPSPDDISLTERLKKAGEILGIKVCDHIVFSYTGYHSMYECGEF